MAKKVNIVSPQITDSVTQDNTKVVGETPAVAMGNLSQTNSQEPNTPGQSTTVTSPQSPVNRHTATTMPVVKLDPADPYNSDKDKE